MQLIEAWKELPFEQIVALYAAVGWQLYAKQPALLKKAFEGSDYVLLALKDGELLGLSRSVSDDVSIHYLQDILVHPKAQRKGVGRAIFGAVLQRYEHVRTHMLLTDDEEKQKLFYTSLGYHNVGLLSKHKLNAFVKMKGVELS